jgi:hypothetical protein
VKARHIRANLRQDPGGGRRLQPSNTLHQLHRLLKRAQVLFDLLFDLGHGLLQKVNMRQDAVQQEAMMRLHTAFQGLSQVGELGAQSPTGQGCQCFGILLSGYYGFEHVTSTLA